MAEPESILQLGIEAARENKKEEARQLFRLLTRQEPDNVQGWLWLAGVAENREERQAALERVLELEPDNEMAVKGLQALGVRPGSATPPPPVAPVVAVAAAAPPPTRAPLDDDPFGEDDPFAELDNLSDVMAADTAGPVRRTEPVLVDDGLSAAEAAAVGGVAGAAAASRGADYPARGEAGSRGSRNAARYVEEEELEPARGGISPLLGLLLFLVGLGLIGLLMFFLFGRQQTAGVDQGATAVVGQTAPAGGVATADPNAPAATADPNAPAATPDPNAPVATADPNAPVATPDPNAPAATPDPNAPPAGGGTSDPNAGGTTAPPPSNEQLATANPAIIPANTPIQSEGWVYDFPQPTYASSIIGNLGQYTPNNGRFVVVLIHAINNTGTPQGIPANFYVLKDAQGRIWETRPEVSDAYVVPGVNADQTQNTPLAPDGNYRSVALVFDVAPDATDLVFFARSNPAQGWLVLRSV